MRILGRTSSNESVSINAIHCERVVLLLQCTCCDGVILAINHEQVLIQQPLGLDYVSELPASIQMPFRRLVGPILQPTHRCLGRA
jgi:hypothetical protein